MSKTIKSNFRISDKRRAYFEDMRSWASTILVRELQEESNENEQTRHWMEWLISQINQGTSPEWQDPYFTMALNKNRKRFEQYEFLLN